MVKYVGFPKEYNYIYCLMFKGITYINLNYTDKECPLKILTYLSKLQPMPLTSRV